MSQSARGSHYEVGDSLRKEVLREVDRRQDCEPAFVYRTALTRQIIEATRRIEGIEAEMDGNWWAGVALVLAERGVDGSKRADDPSELMEAAKGLLYEIHLTGQNISRVSEAMAKVQQALGKLE